MTAPDLPVLLLLVPLLLRCRKKPSSDRAHLTRCPVGHGPEDGFARGGRDHRGPTPRSPQATAGHTAIVELGWGRQAVHFPLCEHSCDMPLLPLRKIPPAPAAATFIAASYYRRAAIGGTKHSSVV